MSSNQYTSLLQRYVGDMLVLERQMEADLEQRLKEVAAHPQTAEAIGRFHRMAAAQRQALAARLRTLGGTEPDSPRTIMPIPPAPTSQAGRDETAQAVSQPLHRLYSAFNHLAFGYTMLHAVAHRAFDSEKEGNTADLAEAHLRGYAAAAQELNQLISDVVIWELDQESQACQCQCPSCSLGICLCASHGTNTVNAAWRETGSSPAEPGILVRPPRGGSPAARAGLRAGDRVVAVAGQEIASDLDAATMQAGVRQNPSGEAIHLRVRRLTGELVDMTVIRS